MISSRKISIVIPCKGIDEYLLECIRHCLSLDYEDTEILVLTDHPQQDAFEKVRFFATGPIKPAEKRNMGIKNSTGEIIAFIDSDAYPDNDWLTNAIEYFNDEKVGAVGGPNLTPPHDNFRQHIYGEILYSRLGLGSRATGMFSKNSNHECDELPSCNLLVRKSLFFEKEIGFFNTHILTCEDSLLCRKIGNAGYKIIYAMDSIVYHHRRSSLFSFIKQVWIFGRDRATVIRNYYNRKMLGHFLPSLFVLGLILGAVVSYYDDHARSIYFAVILCYLIVTILECVTKKQAKMIFPVFLGIIIMHIMYGLGFIQGLLLRNRI